MKQPAPVQSGAVDHRPGNCAGPSTRPPSSSVCLPVLPRPIVLHTVPAPSAAVSTRVLRPSQSLQGKAGMATYYIRPACRLAYVHSSLAVPLHYSSLRRRSSTALVACLALIIIIIIIVSTPFSPIQPFLPYPLGPTFDLATRSKRLSSRSPRYPSVWNHQLCRPLSA
jgi:hypothetical protein